MTNLPPLTPGLNRVNRLPTGDAKAKRICFPPPRTLALTSNRLLCRSPIKLGLLCPRRNLPVPRKLYGLNLHETVIGKTPNLTRPDRTLPLLSTPSTPKTSFRAWLLELPV